MTGLKKNREFLRVYKKGKARADQMLVIYRLRTNEPGVRTGISVSKKVGNSVVRHRVKRRIREICRLNAEWFADGSDYVIVARKPAAEAGYREIERSVARLLGAKGTGALKS